MAYQVDDNGREILIALARASGLSGRYPACSTCTNEGDDGLLQGFRAEVFGIITDFSGSPPVLTVISATVSNGRTASEICVVQQSSNSPTKSPQTVTTVPMISPTVQPSLTKPVITAPTSFFPMEVLSSSPNLNPDAQEPDPTLGFPSMEPLTDKLSGQPSQMVTLSPSYAPDYGSFTVAPARFANSTPIPSSNMSTAGPNTSANNAPPSSTNTGSQNDNGNSRSAGNFNMHIFDSFLMVALHWILVGAVASCW